MQRHWILRRGRAAFTLVEVMVAVLIAGLMIAGASRLLHQLLRGTTLSFRETAATLLAQDKMEQLLQTSYSTLAGGADSSGALNRNWTVGGESDYRKALLVDVSFSVVSTPATHVRLPGYGVTTPALGTVPSFINFPTNFW